jgi:hypothetical protein
MKSEPVTVMISDYLAMKSFVWKIHKKIYYVAAAVCDFFVEKGRKMCVVAVDRDSFLSIDFYHHRHLV